MPIARRSLPVASCTCGWQSFQKFLIEFHTGHSGPFSGDQRGKGVSPLYIMWCYSLCSGIMYSISESSLSSAVACCMASCPPSPPPVAVGVANELVRCAISMARSAGRLRGNLPVCKKEEQGESIFKLDSFVRVCVCVCVGFIWQ